MTGILTVRSAGPGDAAAIARIYNQGIRERIATFETEERTEEDRRLWLATHDRRYPVVVATWDHTVVGWASCDAWTMGRQEPSRSGTSAVVARST